MRKSVVFALLMIVMLIGIYSCIKEPVNESMNYLKNKCDSLFEFLVNDTIISGNILIARGDEILFRRSYGLANIEHGIPVNDLTIFRVGSITKMFTAAAILQLCEKNKLELNDNLSKYLEDYPGGDRINIHHLLTHTSGIINFNYLNDYPEKSMFDHSIEEVIDWFSKEPLIGMPGKDFHYSNSNYVILARIIEIVSKQSYEEYLTNNIFDPLDMYNSGIDNNTKILPGRANGYTKDACGHVSKAPYQSLSFGLGHGAMYSTTGDLLKWCLAFKKNKIISKRSKDLMLTPYSGSYGYGWVIDSLYNRKVVSHGGAISGFMSNIIWFMEDDILIITLYNTETLLQKEIDNRILNIVMENEYKPLFQDYRISDTLELNKYMGTYYSDDSICIDFRTENDKVMIQEDENPVYECSILNEQQLFVKEMNAIIIFNEEQNGDISADIYQGLWLWEANKINH